MVAYHGAVEHSERLIYLSPWFLQVTEKLEKVREFVWSGKGQGKIFF